MLAGGGGFPNPGGILNFGGAFAAGAEGLVVVSLGAEESSSLSKSNVAIFFFF